jgi:hypothetical protein
MITNRDWKVIEFVDKIPCYGDTLQKIFYPSPRVAYYRLSFLHDYLYIKRNRHGANDKYFYFTKRESAQKLHLDLLAKTYLWLINNKYTVDILTVQTQIGNLRPDMTINLERNGKKVYMAVELQRMFDSEKIKKYEESEFKKLLYVSDKKITSNKIEVINLDIKELP